MPPAAAQGLLGPWVSSGGLGSSRRALTLLSADLGNTEQHGWLIVTSHGWVVALTAVLVPRP